MRSAPQTGTTSRSAPWLHDVLPDHFVSHALRFSATGLASAGVQLGVLALLVATGLHSWIGNAIAIATGAQVNFALSQWFTWRDRRTSESLWRRWLRFTCAISSTVGVNFGVFAAASLFFDPLAAAACGIGVAAVANFVLADHFVFVRAGMADVPAVRDKQPIIPLEES